MVIAGNKNKKKEEETNKGMQLGKYQLGRTLGEGNFGKVKFAQDVESGNPFAVKILEKNKILDLKITDQIKREIGTLKLLRHPNIVRLHELDWPIKQRHVYVVLTHKHRATIQDQDQAI